MRESRTYGFVRGAPSNMRPYRDHRSDAFFCAFPCTGAKRISYDIDEW